jgi:hypothetical protein
MVNHLLPWQTFIRRSGVDWMPAASSFGREGGTKWTAVTGFIDNRTLQSMAESASA